MLLLFGWVHVVSYMSNFIVTIGICLFQFLSEKGLNKWWWSAKETYIAAATKKTVEQEEHRAHSSEGKRNRRTKHVVSSGQ